MKNDTPPLIAPQTHPDLPIPIGKPEAKRVIERSKGQSKWLTAGITAML